MLPELTKGQSHSTVLLLAARDPISSAQWRLSDSRMAGRCQHLAGSPPWKGKGTSAPRTQKEPAAPHGPSPNCCSHFQAGESRKNVGQQKRACKLSALINKTWREGNQSCPLGCRQLCLWRLLGGNSQAVPPQPSGRRPGAAPLLASKFCCLSTKGD